MSLLNHVMKLVAWEELLVSCIFKPITAVGNMRHDVYMSKADEEKSKMVSWAITLTNFPREMISSEGREYYEVPTNLAPFAFWRVHFSKTLGFGCYTTAISQGSSREENRSKIDACFAWSQESALIFLLIHTMHKTQAWIDHLNRILVSGCFLTTQVISLLTQSV